VGTFESRLRWHARWRWLGPLLAVTVAAGGVAGWLLLFRPSDPDASRARADVMMLMARDDDASVEQAVSRLDETLRRSPRQRGAAADRALAQVLRAAAIVEEGESLAARRAAQEAERDRLRREQPAGWQDAERAAAAEAQKLDLEVRAREERARALGDAAFQALRRLRGEVGDSPDVARGLAAYYALGGDRDRAGKTIRAARERARADPWLDLAEAWVDARDPDRAARERALVELGALSAAHPELLRGRLLLARTQVGLGRRDEALATLDALIAANAGHEAAGRLRAELSAPVAAPALAPAPAPVPAAPPPAKPPTRPRRLVTQPPAEAAPVPSVALPTPAVPLPSDPTSAPPQPDTAPGAAAEASADGDAGPALAPAATPPGAEVAEPPRPKPSRRIETGPPATDGG
jgi:hypothetical protein